MKTWIWSYDCLTSAGVGPEALWKSLSQGEKHLRPVPTDGWKIPARFEPRACTIPRELATSRGQLGDWLECTYERANKRLVPNLHRKGLILASTKGALEDYVWREKPEVDPVAILLEDFLRKHQSEFQESLCISHACTSFLIALKWAQEWIKQDRVDGVWVLSCDEVGPFVLNGFQSLKALSQGQARPFSGERDGLNLGEAVVAVYISKDAPPLPQAVALEDIAIDTEGFAATRPSQSGDSLLRTCRKVVRETPDFVVAHGTATPINDQIEDQVFRQLFNQAPPIVCTKWSVGHTLGSSAGVDLCAALEIFKHQELFAIASTTKSDPNFISSYLCAGSDLSRSGHFESSLITSLGFGGVHAAAVLRRAP